MNVEEERGYFAFVPPKPDYTVRFHRDGKEVACFDFGTDPITFTGDADAAAQEFVALVKRHWVNLK